MKQTLLLVGCLLAPIAATSVHGQDSVSIVETRSHDVFTGLFRSVWARLRALNPATTQSANSEVVYTAGIRGAESTDTLLKPYWKGDLTRDRAFQAELQQFSVAQLQLDRGDLESAVESFDDFLDEYTASDLRPNALFGKSLSLAGLGRAQASLAAMQLFVAENPNHPLYRDAQQVIAELD